MFEDRISLSRTNLELAITEAVKAMPDCEAFVGVFVMRVKPQSRFDANWSIRGVKFGKTDRDKSGKVLAGIVEVMQRDFILSEDSNPAASASQLAPKPVEGTVSGTAENQARQDQDLYKQQSAYLGGKGNSE